MRELAQALPEGDFRREAEIALQGGRVRVGRRHIARLHGDELLVRLEIVVRRQDARRQQLLLQDLDEVQQVLRLAATDVVNRIRRHRQTVLALAARGSLGHHAHDTFHDIIHIREIATAISVVVDLDRLAGQQLVGEAEIGHVRPPGGAIDREETQARRRDIVQLAVAMRHQLVALLRRRIEAHRIIHPVFHAERNFFITTVNT